jgi:hypothetical protein
MKVSEWDIFGGTMLLLAFIMLASLFIVTDQLSDINIELIKMNYKMEKMK